jgi:hypothetical protein
VCAAYTIELWSTKPVALADIAAQVMQDGRRTPACRQSETKYAALVNGAPPSAVSRRFTNGAALFGYCLLAFLYLGLPIAAHPGRSYVGSTIDPEIVVWLFGWWPHAIGHGMNPIYTHAIWAPAGFNLVWATSTPGLALAFAPLTVLAGPLVSYNVAAILMPALAAWTAYLLCRYLTGAIWPSLLGGYLFGFSSYMLAHTIGHLHLTSVFLVPLVALVLLRYLRGELTGRSAVPRLAALLALQFSFSTELFFTLSLALAAALAIAYCLTPTLRDRLTTLLLPLTAGYALAGVLVSPLLYYAITDFRSNSINPPGLYVADVLNYVFPTPMSLADTSWWYKLSPHFLGNDSERASYLGPPVLAMIVWFGWQRWRTPGGRFLLASFAVAVIAAFGTAIHVNGRRIVAMPWKLIADLPLVDNVITARFAMYVSLTVAVMIAIWAASRATPSWGRVALPSLAVLALLPRIGSTEYHHTPDNPSFFADRLDRVCLRSGENVLVLPYGKNADAMLWQAETGFRFRMAGGYISAGVPKPYERRSVRQIVANTVPSRGAHDLLALAHAMGVTTILVEEKHAEPWRSLLKNVARPRLIGGMFLYSLRGTSCR